jgi:Zn-dependent protease with chaperone function
MAIDFFDQQQAARRRTGRLVVYFVLAVVLIILAIYAAVMGAFVLMSKDQDPAAPGLLFDPGLFALITTGVILVIALGSLYKIVQLREGGVVIARQLGGRLLVPGTANLAEQRLLNVVEEMAIAAGTPVPSVFVLDEEQSINAFAAGFGPGDAVVAVSQGCLDYLTRDELQGVIAHEFSHILNGDMRFNLRLIGLLHGILLLALIGQILMRMTSRTTYYSGSSRRDGERRDSSALAFFLLGLALLIIGFVGVFFGRLIKCAISRQREFLADASALQFTRNPDGLAGALKKIGGLAEGSRIKNPNAEEACHLFFGQGVPSMTQVLATHPPLKVRIQRIDPSFDGRYPKVVPLVGEGEREDRATTTRAARFARESAAPISLTPAVALASIGAPRREHVAFATRLLDSIPEPLDSAAREPFGARAVVYALLLDRTEAVRRMQLDHLEAHEAPGTADEAERLRPIIEALGAKARLPLVDLALPALRQLSRAQCRIFLEEVEALALADQVVSVFEFTLERVLLRHLVRHFLEPAPPVVQFTTLDPLRNDIHVLLSTLASLGHERRDEAERAFAQGWSRLNWPPRAPVFPPRGPGLLDNLRKALDRLAAASPEVKRRVLDASAACVAADGRVTVSEGELLRAIADSLDCPMPPLIAPTSLPSGVEAAEAVVSPAPSVSEP